MLDTGSCDATIAIARSFGADVAGAVWKDDFSGARNVSLEMARFPWILVIDADEELDALTAPRLRQVPCHAGALAFLVIREDLRHDGPPDRIALPRIMKNHPAIRFRRAVHESIMDSLVALGKGALEESGVRLIHYGYLPDAMGRRDKRERNLALLRKNRAEAPDDLYGIVKLAVTLPWRAREEKLEAFGAAHAMARDLRPTEREELPFLPTLYDAHAAALSSYGALTRAIGMVEEGRLRFPNSVPLQFRHGELARRIGDFDLAEQLLRGALDQPHASGIEVDRSAQIDVSCCAALLAIAVELGRPVDPRRDGLARLQEHFLVRMAQLRVLLSEGRIAEASAGLQPLLETHFHDDEVRLFCGELAIAQRDYDTAFALWSLTNPDTDAGQRAEAWLNLLAIRRGEVPRRSRPPRDAAAAAMADIVGQAGGYEVARDAAFRPQAVSRWIDKWLDELHRAGTDLE